VAATAQATARSRNRSEFTQGICAAGDASQFPVAGCPSPWFGRTAREALT
jgi:hypothetical protein